MWFNFNVSVGTECGIYEAVTAVLLVHIGYKVFYYFSVFFELAWEDWHNRTLQAALSGWDGVSPLPHMDTGLPSWAQSQDPSIYKKQKQLSPIFIPEAHKQRKELKVCATYMHILQKGCGIAIL